MSTERDIIIERLEQKLAAKDREFEQMQESLRDAIIAEVEEKFAEKLKLRESTIDEIRIRFGEKVNEILEMNRSIGDSLAQLQGARSEVLTGIDERMNRLERRFVELNSAYEGVMKELLDQKSILQELRSKKKEEGPRQDIRQKNEPTLYKSPDRQKEEVKPREETKQPEKPKPKGEYIVADNYVPKDKRRQQVIIEAEEKMVAPDEASEQKQIFNRPLVKRSERVKEGVEIFETQKRGR